MNSMSKNLKPIVVDLNIGDQLTSVSCGHVVVEIIKFIVYQRLQIPYTYQWLKHVVTKKRNCENDDLKGSFQSEKHYHVASTALDNLDYILKSLLHEINGPSIPEEVCIILGGTPVTCKEIYRLILPTLCHKPQCQSTHIANDQKIQKNIFRTLVTSEMLSQVFFNAMAPTNMYVFIKKSTKNQELINNDNFVPANGHRIPRSSKIVVMDFRTQTTGTMSCCNQFQVFGDIGSNLHDIVPKDPDMEYERSDFNEIESTDKIKWYQSAYVMKGFKDCIVNGSSVANTWLKS
ncbi:uncharacterized protein LOC113519615 [Galleria mellonella]|uniref:Uncharacterized protein LOC113519615 n=1 Tax=Galleria mellonella TaxID=7137 RepID=A0A6J1X3Q6_GALME|nr:uncharacterized protein LOC113519615 [Galleria mellonella]